MPAPWTAGAQARINGTIHGQQTVNVLNFATNSVILDAGALDTLLLQLAVALLECVETTLLDAVTIDWKAVSVDAKRIYPATSDPIVATADPFSTGTLPTTSVSFASTLLSLRTGAGGRRGRGRMFLPPPGEANILNSGVDSTTLAAIAAFAACVATKFLGVSATTDWRLGVLSRVTAGPTLAAFDTGFRQVTSLNPVANMACMRSRKVGHGG